MVLDYTGTSSNSGYIQDLQEYLKNEKDLDWTKQFGEPIPKDHPIWDKYVEVAMAYDTKYVEGMTMAMESLLVFAALFSAIVTTCLIQFEQDLKTEDYDPPTYTAHALYFLITKQIHPFLRAQGIPTPTTIRPIQDPGPYFSTIAITLWYISLDCALLVAGGAVCVKQWLLEYERANTLHRSAYEHAIHRQQRYRNLKKWHVQEFGDFLGSVMLFDLIPFLAGSIYHYNITNTGGHLFNDLSGGFLGLYTAFLAFVIIVGVFIPTSPFKTPISNVIQMIPQKLQNNFRGGGAIKALLAVPFIMGVVIISVIWTKTSVQIFWAVLLWLGPLTLCIGLGLNNGLKMGRVSHYVPLMSIGITILAALSLAFVSIHAYVYHDVVHVGLPFIYTAVFTLVIAGLSRRFSNPESERRLPVNTLLLASAGLAMGIFIGWQYTLSNFSFTDPASGGDVNITYWATPVASGIVWASTTMLCVAFIIPEDEVEEDTREAEALGWLINHTRDHRILQDALLCIPGIANTPLRRAELLESTRDILGSFINSLVDPPQQRCLLANDTGRDGVGMGGVRSAEHERKLKLYVACLAEVSQVAIKGQRRLQRWKGRWNKVLARIHRLGFYLNWYRIATIVPHETLKREHRFPRIWYPWFQRFEPDGLYNNLELLSTDPDHYISTMARAALSQLYPSESPLNEYHLWPVRQDITPGDKSFLTYHKTLVEFRMVTIWAINECRWKKTLGVSLQRHLYRYCRYMLEFSMTRVSLLKEAKKEGINLETGVAEKESTVAQEPQAIEQGETNIPAEGDNDKTGGAEKEFPFELPQQSPISPVIVRRETRWPEDLGNKGVDETEQEQARAKAKADQGDQERRKIVWQYGKSFKSAMVLGYLIIENHRDILRTMYSGESTPMKAARCLMALSRWLDQRPPPSQPLHLNTETRYSFAGALISATHKYLQLAAETYQPSNHLPSPDKSMEHDENTVFVGMKHLEIPLIHLACYSWHNQPELEKLAVSTLELFYSIPGHADVKLVRWDPPADLNVLADRLKLRLQATKAPAEQVSGIRTCTRVLNLMSDPAMITTTAFNGTSVVSSLSDIIGSMAQKDSMELRVAILWAVLETPIFCPRQAGPQAGSPSDSGALAGHVAIDLSPDLSPDPSPGLSPDPNAKNLSQLYKNILKDHLLLLRATSELDGLLARELVELTLLLVEKLVESPDLRGVLLEHEEYPKVLASIAWPSQGVISEESIPARKLAIKLFARLWTSASEGDETKKSTNTYSVELLTCDLQKIVSAVNWFTDHLVTMELDCISLWTDLLLKVRDGNQSPIFKEIVEAFKGAVLYGAFNDPAVENKRSDMFEKLSELQSENVVQPVVTD
ncbi:hypothetical protein FRC03_009117 [Tulasnella sp. 419]|nr:hypothetical protein FRC02_009035 [Tulasnella sp. 418]KAG8958449.1 hypothetical protein FRC03_009117 [Tulasnella sp. 419]